MRVKNFSAAGDTILTDDLSIIERYRQDVAELLLQVRKLVEASAGGASYDLVVQRFQDLLEAVKNWLSNEDAARRGGEMFTRWTAEGERILAEAYDIKALVSGGGRDGLFVAATVVVVLGLAFWANRG